MPLVLPSDLSLFAESVDKMHNPGVYALELSRPDDVAAAWDQHFETRPEWFPRFRDAEGVVYVGAASDVLHRLEDHAAGDVRKTVLTEICTIDSLRNVWWFGSAGRAFERESGIAIILQHERPQLYVHQA